MIEDDEYQSSSQYRCWSMTRQKLNQVRQETNALAAERLRAAFVRSRLAQGQTTENADDDDDDNPVAAAAADLEVQTLSVDEELMIVEWGSDKIMQMGASMRPSKFPNHVIATAIQYLRRFYLTNSPMTYHPRQITACALFLATKAEHWNTRLHDFTSCLENVTEDEVKAPEFLLMQGLRFTLDVRHPMRGLEGGVAEIQILANEGHLNNLQRNVNGKTQSAAQRIGAAADMSKQLLLGAAQMTDAYFLYTPSQIWLAAMLVADRELTLRYLGALFARLGSAASAMKDKLQDVLESCAELLSSYTSAEDDQAKAKEIRKVGRKLNKFQNPEKLDIVAVARAKAAEKREGSKNDPEKALKKRKLEREQLDKDGDVFGPSLKRGA